MTAQLKYDLHMHLFGCLTPEDLWEIGQSQPLSQERLAWFANEFVSAYARKPLLHLYFSKNRHEGIEAIAKDYLCSEKRSFTQFQASFNLAIALNADRFRDGKILEYIVTRQIESGVQYSEPRLVLAPSLSTGEKYDYLSYISESAAKINRAGDRCKLILTLPRDPKTLMTDYRLVKTWQRQAAHAREIISLDLCMDEQCNPPALNEEFIATIVRDNHQSPQYALDLSYHVGESYDRLGLGVSASWVVKVAEMGVHRLGHACSVLIEAEKSNYLQANLNGTLIREHLHETLKNFEQLRAFGYPLTHDQVVELTKTIDQDKLYFWPPTKSEAVFMAKAWQKLACQLLKSRSCIVESCPSSNFFLGEFSTPGSAIQRLQSLDVDFVVGTDDSGLFSTSLAEEIRRCQPDNLTCKLELARIERNCRTLIEQRPTLK